jgi:hypothetical protein
MKVEFEAAEMDELYRETYESFLPCMYGKEKLDLQHELDFLIESVTTRPRDNPPEIFRK